MIKALVTIFDDETDQTFVKDKVLQPFKQEKVSYDPKYVDVDKYTFEFHFMHMNVEKGESK